MINRRGFEEACRMLVAARRHGRDIDPERVVAALLGCLPEEQVGERTFEEQTFPSPAHRQVLDSLTIQEREVFSECLEFLMKEAKQAITKKMN